MSERLGCSALLGHGPVGSCFCNTVQSLKKKKKTEIKGVRKEPGWRTLTLERLRHALSAAVTKGNEASLVDQLVKNLPAMQETQVRSLAQEDPLEEGMTTRSSIIAWRTPWTEELGGLQSMGSQRVGHD